MSVRLSPEKKTACDLSFVEGAVQLGNRNVLAGEHASVENASDGDAAQVVAVIEIRDQYLQRAGNVARGAGVVFKWRRTVAAGFRRRVDIGRGRASLALVYSTGSRADLPGH